WISSWSRVGVAERITSRREPTSIGLASSFVQSNVVDRATDGSARMTARVAAEPSRAAAAATQATCKERIVVLQAFSHGVGWRVGLPAGRGREPTAESREPKAESREPKA